MDLFVVNRYEGDHEVTKEEEESKLDQLYKKIEKNKKRQRKKEVNKATTEAIAKTTLKRHIKREVKSQIVSVPENNIEEFIDGSIEVEQKADIVNEEHKNDRRKRKNGLPESVEGFTVLGAENAIKKKKVKRVLPKWLAEPIIISTNLSELKKKVSSVKQLDKDLRRKLKSNGVEYLFPVQAEVIPWLLTACDHSTILFPRDVCVSAPTGSGKTLAFVLPIIQALRRHFVKKIRALVLLPTQDLALQVFKTFKTYCEGTNMDVCFATGKNSFAVEQKLLISENEAFGSLSKVDILVCTAGRLVDHLKHTKGFDLSELEFLVIDEADRVLDNVQHDWLYHLEEHLDQEDPGQHKMRMVNLINLRKKRPPQKLLFSATLSQDPEKLEKLSLFQPILFTSVVEDDSPNGNQDNHEVTDTFIGKFTTPKELSEKYVVCSLDIKPLVLYKYIKIEKLTKSLVFTNSINEAHRLCILFRALFKDKLKIEEMNSHLEAKNRKELIAAFSKGNIDLLICTDALARGIDLPNVQYVISYSAPKHLKTYIHRAGRTARAGVLGTAVTFLHSSQVLRFKSLLEQAGKNNVEQVEVPTDDLESLGKTYKQALDELKRAVHKEEVDDLKKIKRTKQIKSGNFKRKRTKSNDST
ncbi:hypothetical protein HHI36_003447 [Cryptolaemus montrouzieri]|uniref:ATP-dependent RNA helicase n=1 Tax=Cryptolaemus montrouzieri TaxID=559131 RepID=A0ABD2PDN1_9CUCU